VIDTVVKRRMAATTGAYWNAATIAPGTFTKLDRYTASWSYSHFVEPVTGLVFGMIRYIDQSDIMGFFISAMSEIPCLADRMIAKLSKATVELKRSMRKERGIKAVMSMTRFIDRERRFNVER
jgi:hypothetical protein